MKIDRKFIAEKAGVSVTTVTCVLNGTRPVSQKMYDRVMKVVEEYHYVPDAVARAMVHKGSKQICVVMDDIKNPFMSEFLDAFENAGIQRGYFVNICGRMNIAKYVEHMVARRVDAVYFCTELFEEDLPYIETLLNNGVKVMTQMCFPYFKGRISQIGMQTKQAVTSGMEYLMRMGHTKIGFLTIFSDDNEKDERLTEYKRIMRERLGVENPIYYVPPVTVSASIRSGKELFTAFMRNNPDVTAIFCLNDIIAIGAMRAAQDMGYRVPEHLSFIGIDGIEMSSVVAPRLTTFLSHASDFGEKALDILVNMVEKDIITNYDHPMELFVQESVRSLLPKGDDAL